VPAAAAPPVPAFAAVSVGLVAVIVSPGLVALEPAVALDPVDPAELDVGCPVVSVGAEL
jgi:hypothetical protein